MLLPATDGRAPVPVVVLPEGGEAVPSQLPPGALVLRPTADGYVVVSGGETGQKLDEVNWTPKSGWMLKLAEGPRDDDSIQDKNGWGSPEVLVIPQGSTTAKMRCRLPENAEEELVFGRSKHRSHVVVDANDMQVSRRHMRFYMAGGRHMAEDLDSRGGTFLNGEKLDRPVELKHGDKLRIGGTILEFCHYLAKIDDLEDAVPEGPEPGPVTDPDLDPVADDPDDGGNGGDPDPVTPGWERALYAIGIVAVVAILFFAARELMPGDEARAGVSGPDGNSVPSQGD